MATKTRVELRDRFIKAVKPRQEQLIDDLMDSVPIVATGTEAPTSTPVRAGDIYVDTTANKVYFATGTTNSNDWTAVN